MKYVYIISCQRGQGLPEIYSMWSTYEKAIIAYSECCDSSFDLKFKMLYEFPLDELYCDVKSWSNIKLGKSCKYRIKKFKSLEELRSEAFSLKRDVKLDELGIID